MGKVLSSHLVVNKQATMAKGNCTASFCETTGSPLETAKLKINLHYFTIIKIGLQHVITVSKTKLQQRLTNQRRRASAVKPAIDMPT